MFMLTTAFCGATWRQGRTPIRLPSDDARAERLDVLRRSSIFGESAKRQYSHLGTKAEREVMPPHSSRAPIRAPADVVEWIREALLVPHGDRVLAESCADQRGSVACRPYPLLT